MRLNVRDFASVQDAINAAKAGDSLYFPSLYGTTLGYYQAPVGGWTIDKSLEIFGDGAGGSNLNDSGTTIRPDTTAPNPLGDTVFSISNGVDGLHMHDLKIRLASTPSSTGTKHAISALTTAGNTITRVRLERVHVFNHGGDAFHFEGASGTAAVYEIVLTDCVATNNGGSGAYLKVGNASQILGGLFAGNRQFGIYGEQTGEPRIIGASFESNQAAGSNASFDVQLRLKLCHGFTVMACHFEDFDNNANAKTAVTIENCFGGHIGSSSFINPSGVSGSRGIFVVGPSSGIVVGPNVWDFTDVLVQLNAGDGTTGCVVLPQSVHATDANSAATITLPDGDSNGNFAFVPTTKTSNIGAGLLLPRITTSVRDSIPTPGILQRGIVVYNSTTNKLNFYDGGAWRVVTST